MGMKINATTGLWDVSYGKRHSITRLPVCARRVGIKSKAEARRVHAELILQVERKLQKSKTPTWYQMVEGYKEACLNRGLTVKTVDNSYDCLVAHTYKTWADKPIDSITTSDIRVLHAERVGSRSTSHKKNMLKFIRSVFQHAIEEGVLKSNPTPQMKFQVGDKIKAVLTEKQIKILLNKAKEMECEWYPHWVLALYTGMRNGELYALTWDKVDLEKCNAKVDCSWNNKDGFKSTKSGDDRIVSLAPNLIPILAELKLKNSDSKFVLPRIDKWDRGEQARELRMFLMGLGLPVVRFHDLRASWATVMLGRGIEPIKVMFMGGWKNLETMMIYMRKAGIAIQGITDSLDLHNTSTGGARVMRFEKTS